MHLLLVLAVVAGSASAVPTGVATVVRSSFKTSCLLPSVHQLVASGYALYSAQLPSIVDKIDDLELATAGRGDLLISQDELADGGRIFSRAVYQNDRGTTLHTGGQFSQEGGSVNVDSFVISNGVDTNSVIRLTSSYGLQRVNDSLLRLSSSEGEGEVELHLGFEKSKDYRVYRGQREASTADGESVTVTETITINGHNPYVVYRHTSWQTTEDPEPVAEELSIGSYPFKAINALKIDAKVVETSRSDSAVSNHRPVSTEISYNFDGSSLTEISEGEVTWTVNLELIEDSDVWLEFEGNTGFTGSGLSTLLVRQLRDKGKTDAALIAEELDSELTRYDVIIQ